MTKTKKKPRVKKTLFFQWGNEKYGRPAYWHKSNYNTHVNRHERILTDQQVFIDALNDPDVIFPDKSEKGVSCYYKTEAFSESDGTKTHAQVVVYDDPEVIPRPILGKYVLIKTAMDRDNIPEDGKVQPKFDKRKK